MNDEIDLISDGDGLAVIGDPTAVDRLLSSAGLASKDLELQRRLGSAFSTGAGAAQAGSQVAANSGRWVQLTEQSAKAMKASQLMKGSSAGVNRAVLTTDKGKITGLLEIVKTTPTGMLANPAVLAGAAGIMAQFAMQQTMEEITDYLATIDEKVDDVLRAQKDAALAQVIGVGYVIDEAMSIREEVGRVSEVTWSKVQATSQTIAQAQAYSLLQLDALAEKLEKKSRIGELAKTSREAESKTEEWLAVLARCFQLQDALAVLEIDRVLDAAPEEVDRHRIALHTARRKRREQISRTTERLAARIDAAAGVANAQVLLHPVQAGAVVRSSNRVADDVVVFNQRLGIEADRQSVEAKQWTAAAGEVRDKVLETGTDGVDAAKRLGNKTLDSAKLTTSKLSSGIGQRLSRLHRSDSAKQDDEDQ
ncbi:hypothetical protein [Microlunatus ginsengisoli]|uniref:Uncharacterized protein n=1 Tax=Microlunatus ginsengisoli TaxID=363863 RepID=A0ABP7AJ07_9ACTN